MTDTFTIPINENVDLKKIKNDIIKKINEIEHTDRETHLVFDRLYTLLYNDELVEKVIPYLSPILEKEYSQKDIDAIVAKFISIEDLTLDQKNTFLTNFSTNKCINDSLLTTPGYHSLMDVFYQNELNYKVFVNFIGFGVGKQRAGKAEHSFSILSHNITQKGKGDIDVNGIPVELKVAATEGSGRLGEGGVNPEQVKEIISRYPKLNESIQNFQTGAHQTIKSKGTVDNPQKSVNLTTFVDIANELDMAEDEREKLGNDIFGNVFGAYGQAVTEVFKVPGANSKDVLNKYIETNFDWYKNDLEMGGKWDYLVSIGMQDGAFVVAETGKQLVDLSTSKKIRKSTPAVIPCQGPEVFFQVNPSKMQQEK